MQWAYHLSFFRYAVEAIAVKEFSGTNFHCSNDGYPIPILLANGTAVTKPYCPIPNGDVFLKKFGMRKSLMWVDVGVLVGFYLAFIVVVLVALRFLKHTKR